jgi:hypothetical protein
MRIPAMVCALPMLFVLAAGCTDSTEDYVRPVKVATAVPADAIEGFPYSFQFVAVGGVASNYEWTLQEGTLPSGVTLDASGVLSGTPLITGTHSFTVNVRELTMPFVSDNDTRQLTLAVKAWQRPVEITGSGMDSRKPSVVTDSTGASHGVWDGIA